MPNTNSMCLYFCDSCIHVCWLEKKEQRDFHTTVVKVEKTH